MPIKTNSYNINDGSAERDFSKISMGIASFGKDIEAKVAPYLTNGKYINIEFTPDIFGN
jgi:hypothetical protein